MSFNDSHLIVLASFLDICKVQSVRDLISSAVWFPSVIFPLHDEEEDDE